MSLINRLSQESIKQNKLISQLSEISYRTINGKRQNARNFNEGTLNVGTMNFNTPQDKITKDMFLDYQKTEQEKHYNDGTNKLQYDPSSKVMYNFGVGPRFVYVSVTFSPSPKIINTLAPF
jgi:hypothetical protein